MWPFFGDPIHFLFCLHVLTYIKSNKHFTLKNIEKRVSTLKSLPPKKVKGTIKNTHKAITIGENVAETTNSDIIE